MKKVISIIALISVLGFSIHAHARTTMVCQTISGQQFVWVGTNCPPGSFWVSF
jgi:hypothetical protein